MASLLLRARPLLGTIVEISVEKSSSDANSAIESAFSKIELIHRLLSFHEPSSDLSRLNNSNGVELEVHPVSAQVIRLARGFTAKSKGLFNCTIAGKMQRLGFLPSYNRCKSTDVGQASDILVRGRSVKLQHGVSITLDGIAKGFAVDLATKELIRHKVEGAIVNAGGDLRVIGKADAPIYRRELSGCVTMLGNIKNMAVATSQVGVVPSADFPGCILAADERILSPAVVTIISTSAWRADALTKVAAIAHFSTRKKLVHELGGELLL